MNITKQLLLLKKEGVSNRKAAAIVGINKETVNNYVKKALADDTICHCVSKAQAEHLK